MTGTTWRRPAALDLRLAGPAGAAWLGAAFADGWPPPRDLWASAVLAVLALAAGATRHLALAGVCLGLCVGSAAIAIQVAGLHRGPLAGLAQQQHGRGRLAMTVVRDPVRLVSANGFAFVLVDATVSAVDGRSARSPVVVLAHGGGWLGLLPGQRLVVEARVRPPRPGDDVSAVVVPAGPPRLVGRPPWWQRLAGRVRLALRRACSSLPADERGLVPGLVLGDVSSMPPSLAKAFRVTGLTHLNAVSGENVAILLAAVGGLSRRAGLRRRLRPIVAGLALAGFVVLVRPSPSVLRAAVMGAVVLAAALSGRRAQPLPSLAAAVLLLVLVDPFLARDPGFALSVLATGAIVVLAPTWTRRLSRWMPRPLAVMVAVPMAAQLACTPVIVAVFGQLTPWAVPANLAAAPVVAPATLVGIACALVAIGVPGLASMLAWGAAAPAWWLAVVARTFSTFPAAGLGWPRGVAGLALLGAVVLTTLGVVHAARRGRGRAILGRWPP